jgi:SAM-dependent methyltransferase
MSLRFHEIAETNHQILNPFTHEKLMLLGEICRLQAGMRQLDLACGKGEMLCQWARKWGIYGIGVDISKVFLAAAQQRMVELGVQANVQFVEADAGQYIAQNADFDIVICIGATWIGGGLVGTLRLMQPLLKENGLLLVGEPYWIDSPPDAAYESSGIGKDDFTSLVGTLNRIESAGFELVEMVLADQDSWDRYCAAQWWTLHHWLRDNPDDVDTSAFRDILNNSRRDYLEYGRRYLGWGVFVMKASV